MTDPIVDEVRQIRDAHTARFNYDLDAIFQDIKEREKKSGLKFVSGVARPAMSDQHSRPPEATIPVPADMHSLPAVPPAER